MNLTETIGKLYDSGFDVSDIADHMGMVQSHVQMHVDLYLSSDEYDDADGMVDDDFEVIG